MATAKPWLRDRVHNYIATYMLTNGKVRNIRKGENINSDEYYPYVSYILHGAVAPVWTLTVPVINKKLEYIFLLLRGRIFGNLALTENKAHDLHFEAIADSCIYEVPLERYIHKCKTDPVFMWHHMEHNASVRFSDTKYLAACVGLDPENLAKLLLRTLVLEIGEKDGEWFVIPLKITHTLYGRLLKLSKITINKIFLKWKQEGMTCIKNSYRYVHPDLFSDI